MKNNLLKVGVLMVGLSVVLSFAVLPKSRAANATLSLTPSSQTVANGATFTVAINLDSGVEPVNAVQSDLSFPAAKVQYVSADSSNSAFTIAAQTSADNAAGTVSIARGAPGGTSLSGTQLIAVVTFKAVQTGAVSIGFGNGSAVVRTSDTANILTVKNGAQVTINPPVASGCQNQTTVFRFWSQRFNNSHFFTASTFERDALLVDRNWTYEGTSFCVRSAPLANYLPVYRYWSPKFNNNHFFTTNEAERAALASDRNWTYEGISFYVPANASVDPAAVAINRYWSPRFNNDHFFTGSAAEKAALTTDRNWTYEGIGWYAEIPQ